MESKRFKHLVATTASLMTLALAAAPMGLAGEDEEDGSDGGGGSDSGSASGGIQTGFGGMVATADTDAVTIPIALAGGGFALLTLAGIASRRRRFE
jgi:hypothetical protein